MNQFPHDSDVVKDAQEVLRIAERKQVVRTRTIFDSFRHASEGLIFAVKTQRNVRIHLFAFAAVLGAGWILKVSLSHMAVLLTVSIAVVFAEMINTAIELILDMVNGTRYHPTVKVIKDLAAAGVLLTALGAFIVGIIIFSKYIVLRIA